MGWDRSDFDIGWMAGVFFTKKSSEREISLLRATVRTLRLKFPGPITGEKAVGLAVGYNCEFPHPGQKIASRVALEPCGWTLAPRTAPRYPRPGALWRRQRAQPCCLEGPIATAGRAKSVLPTGP